MTTVHTVPAGEPLEDHKLGDCPCRPRPKPIPRDDGTIEIVHLHRTLDDEATTCS